MTLSGFLYFWGFVFLAATTLVAVFKTENEETNDSSGDGEPDLGYYLMTYYVLYYFINTLITKIIRAVRDVRAAVEDRAAAADADDDRRAADEQGRLLGGRQRHVAQARRAGRAQGQALHARHPTHPPAGKYTKSATFCQQFEIVNFHYQNIS